MESGVSVVGAIFPWLKISIWKVKDQGFLSPRFHGLEDSGFLMTLCADYRLSRWL